MIKKFLKYIEIVMPIAMVVIIIAAAFYAIDKKSIGIYEYEVEEIVIAENAGEGADESADLNKNNNLYISDNEDSNSDLNSSDYRSVDESNASADNYEGNEHNSELGYENNNQAAVENSIDNVNNDANYNASNNKNNNTINNTNNNSVENVNLESNNSENVIEKYKSGKYNITVKCFADEDEMFDNYDLTMEVTIESDRISKIENIYQNGDASNESFITRAKGMIDKIILTDANHINEIDSISGATCTSKAIIEGCEKAYEKSSN